MKPLDPRLLTHARAARPFLVGSVLAGTASAVLVVVQATVVAHLLATAARGDGWGGPGLSAGASLAVLVGAVAGRAALSWVSELAAYRSSAAVKTQLRQGILAASIQRGPAYLAGDRGGELATLSTRGLDALDAYFARYLPQLVLAGTIPVVVGARILAADWVTAVIIAVTIPLIPVFMALIGITAQRHTNRQYALLSRLGAHFLDVVAGLPTLRVFGRAKAAAAGVRRVTDDYRKATMSTLRLAFLSALVLELLATVSTALVAVSVGLRLVDSHIGYETALLVLLLTPEVYLPLRAVGVQFHASMEGVAAAEKAFAVLEGDPAAPAPADPADPAAALGPASVTERAGHPPYGASTPDLATATITLAGVSVAYDGRATPSLDDVTLTLAPGEHVALVGPSGAGKSTVVSLLLRFVEPSAGELRIDHPRLGPTPVADVDPAWWRRRIAWVPQRAHLFAGSVADNIRLGEPAASDDAVRRAAALACADGFIEALPDGYATVLGERGAGLSGGQRQRIALARAFLRDAPVVLLDEPTAGLDGQSQADVVEAMARLVEGRTVLVVAHRVRMAREADRVVVLDGGRVVQQGPPDELADVPGRWRELLAASR